MADVINPYMSLHQRGCTNQVVNISNEMGQGSACRKNINEKLFVSHNKPPEQAPQTVKMMNSSHIK